MTGASGLIVVGAGGHAKVCIEVLRASGRRVHYCVGGEGSPALCMGVPVEVGDDSLAFLAGLGYTDLFVAVGDNRTRERLAEFALGLGYQLVNAISPHAVVSPSARLGNGIAVMAGAVIQADSIIEDLAILNTGSMIDHDCVIAGAAHVGPRCALAGGVVAGRRSQLGAGAVCIPGVVVGDDAVVGAGAVVIDDIPEGVTVAGVPARVIR